MEKVTSDLFSDWHNALQMNIVVELPPMVLAPLVSVTNFAMVEVLPKKRRHLWVLDNDVSISLEAAFSYIDGSLIVDNGHINVGSANTLSFAYCQFLPRFRTPGFSKAINQKMETNIDWE